MSDPAHPFHLTAEQCAGIDAEIEQRLDSLAAQTVDRINATDWMRSCLKQTAPRTFEVEDAVHNGRVTATITFNERGECWEVALLGTDPEYTPGPGDRGFRDFDAAAFYAEAWLWEIDGDF